MEFDEFKSILQLQTKKFKINLTDDMLFKFYKYMNLLIETNKNINLTAIIEPKDIILKHFIDSLTINCYVSKRESIVDIGTGAGFPGVPLAILREDINVLLVDSLQKRVNFLNKVIEELNLTNVKAIHARAEELGQMTEYREKFDVVTSRAVANMSTLMEYMIPFANKNGICIIMKGSNIEEELKKAENAIRILGGKLEKREEFYLSDKENKRNIVVVKKILHTPSKYPRLQGKATKEPIE